MTDTETAAANTSLEANLRRREALGLAMTFVMETVITDGDYLRTTLALGGATRPVSWRDVIEAANAFDLFLMGQGPLVAELTFRVRVDKPDAEPTPPTAEPPPESTL